MRRMSGTGRNIGRRSAPTRVVIVEDRAHESLGHFPVRFATLARAFDTIGVAVEVVTSRGWAGDHRADDGPIPFRVHRYGPITRRLDHLGGLSRARRRGVVQHLGSLLRVVAMVAAARAVRRRFAPGAPIIVTSYECDPVAVSAFAGREPWLLYQFHPPSAPGTGIERAIDRLVLLGARVAARFRTAPLALALPSDAWLDRWRAHAPFLRSLVLPLAGCEPRDEIRDARRRLDVPEHGRLALYFGAAHPDKDSEVVRQAFAALPDWRLLVVGDVASEFRDWAPGAGTPAPILLDGRVDAETAALAHAAADLAVLSFRAGHRRGSGTLMDAIAWGLPVVCSGQSSASDTVRELGLGTVFEPGDGDDLVRAVRAAPAELAPEDVARAQDAHSNVTIARRCLETLAA